MARRFAEHFQFHKGVRYYGRNNDKHNYVDYDSDTTDNLRFIEFEDLMVGDIVILGIYESELKRTDSILVEDIQLSTQRLD